MLIRNKGLFMTLILGMLSLSIYAQKKTDSLYIQLLDQNHQAVPAALVNIGKKHLVSDKQGLVIIDRNTIQKEIEVRSINHEPLVWKWSPNEVGDTLQLFLVEKRYSLDEIEIKGHQQWVETTSPLHYIDQEEINKKTGGSLAQVLEDIRGVNTLKTGNTIEKPVVHGLHSNRILIVNNGIKLQGQEWGVEHAPEIDPYAMGEVKLIKGAESIKYGADAMGGTLVVNPPQLRTDSTIYGSVRTMLASNTKMASGALRLGGHHQALPSWAWMVQASGRRAGNYKTADYYLDNTGIKDWSVQAQLAFIRDHFQSDLSYSLLHNKIGIYKGSHLGSLEDLAHALEKGRPVDDGLFSYTIDNPYQAINHHVLKWRNHIHLSDYTHLTAQYAFQWNQRQEYDIRRGNRSTIPSIDLSLQSHDIQLSVDMMLEHDIELDFGLDLNYQENKNLPGTFTTPLIPDFIQQKGALYIIGKWMPRRWKVQAGMRGELMRLDALGYDQFGDLYGGINDYQNLLASVGAEYNPNNFWQFSLSSGMAWRAPHVNELYSTGLHHGSAAFELGNENLLPEQSWKNIAAIKWMSSFDVDLEVELFSHLFQNYIYLNPTGTFQESMRGAFPIFTYEQDNAHLYGLDALVKWHITSYLDYSIQGSFIQAENLNTKGPFPQIPAHQGRQSILLQMGHWKKMRMPYVKLEHVYVSQQKNYVEGLDFVAPPEAYHLLNASLGTKWIWGNHQLSIDLSVQNITNQLYKDYLNRFRYYAHDLGRTFQLRINYEF